MDQLHQDLYEVADQREKELIESTLSGMNQDIKPIIKDKDLRMLWMHIIYKNSITKK